ncbi:YkvA family protein [Clostridium manihotivorum]|uniref:DUF1232 domain-containing protein n=1 Tax=Clostridium manihotivorum TaxID=2320868 RepID=A0A3R5QWD2_9CLOT|nr:YkvA family protein [Clostridium manihotivorum]QAA34172.1 hypothetical protein C1I91_22465 [Clostridium manihotivorum]
MQISQVTARISGQDIMSIISDFVKVEGLSFENIEIRDTIEVEGNFKKIVNIKFKGKVEIYGVSDNIISLNISNVKVMKLGILNFVKNLALKVAFKSLGDMGISLEDNIVKINVNSILRLVPFLKLNINKLNLKDGFVMADIDSASIDMKRIGEEPEDIKEAIAEDEASSQTIVLSEIEKVKDGYTEKRDKVAEKLPKKLEKYSEYIFILPDIVALIYRLLKDKRVPKKTKISLVASMAYVTLPFDFIPDKLPFIGSVDDLGVVFFALNRVVEDVPLEVILENWQGKNEFIEILKSAVEYLSKYTAAKNIDKVYNVINQLVEI